APLRADATAITVLTLSHEARTLGETIPAGSYGLFLVINEVNTVELVLSKDYKASGNYWYDHAHDQSPAPITIREHPMTERLTYEFINLDKTSSELVLNWEKKQLPVKIEFAVDDIVMANARDELSNVVGFTWQGY